MSLRGPVVGLAAMVAIGATSSSATDPPDRRTAVSATWLVEKALPAREDFAALLERMVERQNLGLPPAPLAALNTTATTATTTITTTQEEVSV